MDILTRQENGVLTIEFNRPDKKNSITSEMYQMIADALARGQNDPSTRVVVMMGKPDIFSAGNDLIDFMNHAADGDLSERPVAKFMANMVAMTKPVIACVTGAAIGIGTTMLLHCDLIYASEKATFSMPFAKLGLCPEFGSSMLLTQTIGYQKTAEKLFFGEPFSAREACEMGLVNQVLPADELTAFVYAQAAKLARLPASSLRTTKGLMKSAQAEAVKARIIEENKFFSAMLSSPEAKEAFDAFFKKRQPDFSKFS
ncbi:MAG: enoyl-CoA hydratase [Smithellaceae bacterium]